MNGFPGDPRPPAILKPRPGFFRIVTSIYSNKNEEKSIQCSYKNIFIETLNSIFFYKNTFRETLNGFPGNSRPPAMLKPRPEFFRIVTSIWTMRKRNIQYFYKNNIFTKKNTFRETFNGFAGEPRPPMILNPTPGFFRIVTSIYSNYN